ncbi:putative PHD type zinc finger protein with BAH domain-containing protein [Scheffersomyces stipitis CBS 6054]|uniref:Hypothetical PHD type zinc finger protein with BAH domain-containing protein n=1 Tax=Scheffersomyces stipitis (strain ATCC 58785 / CBS 6054 / NBRC 10063 / NRRL Y-11545) TaxID=322104 RepID=A3GF32_PICST|nr:hypothetical PHD type zinc finger protein with BAH domain-containing protein [Scheffersomyces stipitis CBS 6054]EAZ63686.2 putative PHD type zinc finger protein with BAH domain-containing protein [Scheffersomyces stipitis CBS 6054]
MSSRPKRKATINKSYSDTLEDYPIEELSKSSSASSITSLVSNNSSRRKPMKRTSSAVDVTSSNGNSSSSVSTPKASSKPQMPHNWQPPVSVADYFSQKLDLTDAYIDLSIQTLYCPRHENVHFISDRSNSSNGKRKNSKKPLFKLQKGDYIYMVSEPPGEPYYIARIMGFKLKDKSHGHDEHLEHEEAHRIGNGNSATAIVDANGYCFQVQWFYRPRDISKTTSDSRLLFASMHTDTCPLLSFRGIVTVEHKQDIEDRFGSQNESSSNNTKKSTSPPNVSALESYIQNPNCFYFDKLFDRYMIKFYDIFSTRNLLQYTTVENSKSKNFLIALNKRFEFIFVEGTRAKSFVNTFSSTSCNCEHCGQWCSSTQDSINCVECGKFYHMLCLDPPLLKRPSRGFSWSCAACTKRHDIEYHKKKMLMLSHDNKSSNASQLTKELDALKSAIIEDTESTPGGEDDETQIILPKFETMAIDFLLNDADLTLEQRRLKEEWPMRYLGMHARLEDGVDIDDRSPYPRASTRLGAKHQATNIPEFYDHPIEYYDVDKPNSKKVKSNGKKNNHDNKEPMEKLVVPDEYKDLSPKEYPQWLQPRPKGYVERGVDDGEGMTCTLLWKSSDVDVENNFEKLDSYIQRCEPIATRLNMLSTSPNFMDSVVNAYMRYDGDVDRAYDEIMKLTRKTLKEPTFTKEEVKRFESGVKEFGSELYPVFGDSVIALCFRCAKLWRRYAVVWEDPNEVEKKNTKTSGWKKKVEPELISDSVAILEEAETQGATLSYAFDYESESSLTAAVFERSVTPSGKVEQKIITKKKVKPEYVNAVKEEKEETKTMNKKRKTSTATSTTSKNPKTANGKTSKTASAVSKSRSKEKPETETKIKAENEGDEALDEKPTKGVKSRKRKQETIESNLVEKEVLISQQTTKKQRKHANSMASKIFNPIFSVDYNPPASTLTTKIDKKLYPNLSKNSLENIIKNYRTRQLLDLTSQLQVLTVPHLTSVELPFQTHDRKCCVCREHDTAENSKLEMLICSNCGVNIHSSCAGIAIPEGAQKPVKQWLCEPCVNDLKPFNSTVYSCSMCLAKESNYELSMLGSPLVRPDFLKPIYESGKWCHLLCAIFNHDLISFRPSTTTSNSSKRIIKEDVSDMRAMVDAIYSGIHIESVSKVFIQNYRSTCGICQSRNGSMVKCDLCDDNIKYHLTCAQDTPNFKLGFKLVAPVNEKDHQIVKVGNVVGKLKPILVCPKHDQSTSTVANLRSIGKRVFGVNKDEPKPLIQLFLEDAVKNNTIKLTGPQLRSKSYIENYNLFRGESEFNRQNSLLSLHNEQSEKICSACNTRTSPMWWNKERTSQAKIEQIESNGPQSKEVYLCQSCYHNNDDDDKNETDDTEEGESLIDVLRKPMSAEHYGIRNEKDRLSDIYVSKLLQEKTPAKESSSSGETTRSKISLGDILS